MVAEGAVEHFKMHSVDRSVSNARNIGSEMMTPTLFPEMEAQGKAKPTKESLLRRRKSSIAEIETTIDARLSELTTGGGPNLAERRLWVRELRDRDNADHLIELIDAIRASIKPVAPERATPKTDQGSLF